MNFCDVHTHIGHWPFRRLPFTDVPSLLKQMDRLSIERAVVCNTHCVFYKHVQAGNEELYAQTRSHRDRLIPAATLNPFYVKAEEDLARCREDYGFSLLRLAPTYHGFALTDSRTIAFARRAADRGMVLLVPRLLVDVRQKHPLDVSVTVEQDELVRFAREVDQGTIIGVEFALSADGATAREIARTPNLFLGISRLPCLNRRVLPELIQRVGADRFLFASGMPFKGGETNVVKIAALPDAASRRAVARENFRRILGP